MLKVFLCQEEAKRSFICPTDTVANAVQKEKKTQINHYFPSLFKKGKKSCAAFTEMELIFFMHLETLLTVTVNKKSRLLADRKKKKLRQRVIRAFIPRRSF